MKTILIVDDEPDILELVRYNLERAGFRTSSAASGREALEQARSAVPDLIVLDIMLPDIDGIEVCRRLRRDERLREIPVLMLTARGEEIDRVLGFELGADDYVTKPFSPRELVLRINSILRRSRGGKSDSVTIGKLEIIPAERRCLLAGRPVPLAAKEYDLLLALAQAEGNVRTRGELLSEIWEYRTDVNTRTLDTHVRRLREKLGPEGRRLETVRGVGYRLARD